MAQKTHRSPTRPTDDPGECVGLLLADLSTTKISKSSDLKKQCNELSLASSLGNASRDGKFLGTSCSCGGHKGGLGGPAESEDEEDVNVGTLSSSIPSFSDWSCCLSLVVLEVPFSSAWSWEACSSRAPEATVEGLADARRDSNMEAASMVTSGPFFFLVPGCCCSCCCCSFCCFFCEPSLGRGGGGGGGGAC